MAKIPRYYSERLPPGETSLVAPSPRLVGREGETWAGVGRQIQETAQLAIGVFGRIENENRKLAIESKAEEAENLIDERVHKISEQFNFRTDWDIFDSDKFINDEIQAIRDELENRRIFRAFSWEGGELTSRKIKNATEKTLNKYSGDLRNIATLKRNQFLTDKRNLEFGKMYEFAQNKFIQESDPEVRKMIKGELELKALAVGSQYALNLMKDFDSKVSDLAEVQADNAIMANPAKALIDLQNPKYLPDLLPKERQDKIEKANRALKVFQDEQNKKLKEEEKLNHDNEEREIGNLFMKKEFTKAYNMAQLSKYLTGDEKKTWATSIESASKKTDDDIDPIIETSNYAFVNELIAKEVNPQTIRNYIMSYEFKSGTRQKLIDRLDKEIDTAINKAKSRAYDYMKSQIMPYGGMLAEVPPLQAANYTKAMNALDDWINDQRKTGKPISSKDIRTKSEELAVTFQTSIAERQEFTAQENKEYFESLKKKKEKKIEPSQQTQPVEKYEINKIYTDAQGRKAKYLGDGKWQLVK